MLPALLLTIVLIAFFWVLIIRPQQLRQREHVAMVDALQVGDRIEAFSGIHGTITEVREGTVRVEVAPGVIVTMASLAVASKLPQTDEEDQVLPPTDLPGGDES